MNQPGRDYVIDRPPIRALIPEGEYDARIVAIARDADMFENKRKQLRISFEIYKGEAGYDGVVLNVIDGYFAETDGKKRTGPASKLARLFQLADPSGQVTSTNVLRDKLYRVRVKSVTKNRYKQPLPAAIQYSAVAEVLDRIA